MFLHAPAFVPPLRVLSLGPPTFHCPRACTPSHAASQESTNDGSREEALGAQMMRSSPPSSSDRLRSVPISTRAPTSAATSRSRRRYRKTGSRSDRSGIVPGGILVSKGETYAFRIRERRASEPVRGAIGRSGYERNERALRGSKKSVPRETVARARANVVDHFARPEARS